MPKAKRITVLVEAKLVAAAKQATQRGDALTLSAWVNDAIRMKLEHDRKLRGLAEVVADWEREFGTITDQDRAEALREARRRASQVRSKA
jgi:hypothetical protein